MQAETLGLANAGAHAQHPCGCECDSRGSILAHECSPQAAARPADLPHMQLPVAGRGLPLQGLRLLDQLRNLGSIPSLVWSKHRCEPLDIKRQHAQRVFERWFYILQKVRSVTRVDWLYYLRLRQLYQRQRPHGRK